MTNSATRTPSLVVVGLGPRGVISIERLGALLPGSGVECCELHLVEEYQPGAGKVWATDQHRELCMNTLAGAVTLFTDESYTGPGPILPGPTQYEWCVAVREHLAGGEWTLDAPLRDAVRTGGYEAELAQTRPESHPSRALYGEYLVWCYERALSRLPASVSVTVHDARATAISEEEGRTVVALSTGERLAADSVVLATGWLDVGPGPADAALAEQVAAAGLTWVTPESPILQDLTGVPAGETVIARGLGMGFFDTMALLTIGRGGRFVPSEEPGGLSYEPSGEEPVLYVGSRRGVPYRAKSLYGGLPPAASLEHLRARDWSTVPRPIDYAREVWPLVVQDAYAAYYRTLYEEVPGAFLDGLEPVLAAIDTASPDTIDDAVSPACRRDPRLRPRAARRPCAGSYDSPESFDAFVATYVAEDLIEAEKGTRSALKAGLWSISASRKFAIQLLTFDERRRGLARRGPRLPALVRRHGRQRPARLPQPAAAGAAARGTRPLHRTVDAGQGRGRHVLGLLADRRRLDRAVARARRRLDAQPRPRPHAGRAHGLPRRGGSRPSVHAGRSRRQPSARAPLRTSTR